MGVIGKKLASRFRKAKRQRDDLRRQAAADFAPVPKDVKGVEALVRSGHDPLHAACVAAQHFTSFFAEAVSPFPEFDPYCQIVGPAQDEYLPSRPPCKSLALPVYFKPGTTPEGTHRQRGHHRCASGSEYENCGRPRASASGCSASGSACRSPISARSRTASSTSATTPAKT